MKHLKHQILFIPTNTNNFFSSIKTLNSKGKTSGRKLWKVNLGLV